MTLLDRLRTIVDGQTVSARPEQRTATSSALYRCARCDLTYIATEMDACPECDADVEEVPSELDLDFGPGGQR